LRCAVSARMIPPAVVFSASATLTSTRSAVGAICGRRGRGRVSQGADWHRGREASYPLSRKVVRPRRGDATGRLLDDSHWARPSRAQRTQRRTFLYCSGISKPLAAARTATLRLGATRRPGAAAAFAATLEAMVKAIVWVESNAGVALCRRVSGRREGRPRGRECRDVRVRNAGRARTEAPSKIGSGAFLLPG